MSNKSLNVYSKRRNLLPSGMDYMIRVGCAVRVRVFGDMILCLSFCVDVVLVESL